MTAIIKQKVISSANSKIKKPATNTKGGAQTSSQKHP